MSYTRTDFLSFIQELYMIENLRDNSKNLKL